MNIFDVIKNQTRALELAQNRRHEAQKASRAAELKALADEADAHFDRRRNRHERKNPDPARYMTPWGAARTLHVSDQTVYRMMDRGDLRFVDVNGIRWVEKESLDEVSLNRYGGLHA